MGFNSDADGSVLIDGRTVVWLVLLDPDIDSFSIAAAVANGSPRSPPGGGGGGECDDGSDNCRCSGKCECGSGR